MEEHVFNIEYQDTFADIDRAAKRGYGATIGLDGERKDVKDQTPQERFESIVGELAKNFDYQEDIDRLLYDLIDKIYPQKIEYLNPTAYFLGYIATGGGIKLNKREFEKAITYLNSIYIIDKSVTRTDVLRYARFWVKIKK
jgi:hypothetical protein